MAKILRKLTELITPPPFRRTAKPKPVPAYVEQATLAPTLRPLLKQLMTAPSIQDRAARQSLLEIKEIALEKGLYLTAFEVKNKLDIIPELDAKGNRYHKSRGYVLAGDFFLAHIQGEIGAIKNESDPIGPRIFRSYCNEMIACLLEGENVRRAIETPIVVVDDLLSSAVDCFEKCDVCLELISQVVASALELTRQHLEREGTGSAPRGAHPEAKHGSPIPAPKSPFTTLDKAAISYLEDIEDKVKQIWDGFLEYRVDLRSEENQAGDVFASVPSRPEHLHALLRVANAAEYLPFAASLKERTGGLVERGQAEQAKEFFRGAAEDCEAQGDRENRLFFAKLSRKRYKKARDLFLRADDRERAARVASKIPDKQPHKQD